MTKEELLIWFAEEKPCIEQRDNETWIYLSHWQVHDFWENIEDALVWICELNGYLESRLHEEYLDVNIDLVLEFYEITLQELTDRTSG